MDIREDQNIEQKNENKNYFSYILIAFGLIYLLISKRFDILLYVVSVAFSFGLVVLIHEGGHFLAAKSVGMKVNEFALGMGPILFSFQKGETLYSIRAFPIGGFMKPEGEDEESENPRAFGNKPLWARAITVGAGPVANFILAFVIIIGLIIFAGVPSIKINNSLLSPTNNTAVLQEGDIIKEINNQKVFLLEEFYNAISDVQANNTLLNVIRDNKEIQLNVPSTYSHVLNRNVANMNTVIVGEVSPDSPASAAGIKPGDVVTKINNKTIYVPEEMQKIITDSGGSELVLIVNRAGNEMRIPIKPEHSSQYNRYLIGITFTPFFGGSFYKYSFAENVENSILYSSTLFEQLGGLLKRLFTGNITKEEVGGPVKIISITVEVTKLGIYPLIHFIAMLSLSLGIFNLFPFPALDGGRLAFFAVEGVRGKPVDQKIEGMIHFIGFVILIIILVYVTYNDILGLFTS